MASVPCSLPPILRRRWELRRWPDSLGARTGLRLALCLPYVLLAAILAHRGVTSVANRAVEAQGRDVHGGGTGLGWLAHAYPPVPTALASILPGGATTLGFVGALFAGGMLHLVWERLVRAGTPGWLTALMLVVFGGTPVFWYTSTEDLAGFAGLSLVTVALASLLDFIFDGRTAGGFNAGIALGAAVLFDPTAIVYAIAVLLAAPLLAWDRLRDEPYVARAILAVVAYPTVALVGAWAYLEWRFTGSPFHASSVAPDFLRFPGGFLSSLVSASHSTELAVATCPLFLAAVVLAAKGRVRSPLVLCLVPALVLLTTWAGLGRATTGGVILMTLVALLAVPSRPTRTTAVLLGLASAAQGAIWITVLVPDGPVGPWLRGIGL